MFAQTDFEKLIQKITKIKNLIKKKKKNNNNEMINSLSLNPEFKENLKYCLPCVLVPRCELMIFFFDFT